VSEPTPEAFRATLRQQFTAPLDPDDERAGLDHVDRAVTIALGVAAAGGHQLGQLSLAPGTRTFYAGLELVGYLRELLQAEHDSGYDAGHEDGYVAAITARDDQAHARAVQR